MLSEITLTGNGILLKSERIILPESLHDDVIKLAHRGNHPGISGLERRLRSHFFFFNMQEKVTRFITMCSDCNIFTDKKTTEPIIPHKVPSKCWESVAVDLFGPMTSAKDVVVQDTGLRYHVAKLVRNTSGEEVLPALGDIYDNYGNPD